MSDFDDKVQQFRVFYAANSALLHNAAEAFRGLLELLLGDRDEFGTPKVICRVKERDECISKFKRKYLAAFEDSGDDYAIEDSLTDLIGVRVVTLYDDEVEIISRIVAAEFEVLNITDKTAALEETEDTFGYKGLHMDLRIDAKRRELPEYLKVASFRFELQIRTMIQDGWSTLDHEIKYKRNIPQQLKRRINSLAALFEIADTQFREVREQTRELQNVAVADNAGDPEGDVLTAFTLSAVARSLFTDYPFIANRLDAFAEELAGLNPELTPSAILGSYNEHADLLQNYRDDQYARNRHKPNPFTMLRYAVYLLDPDQHARVLRPSQRTGLDGWLKARQASEGDGVA